MSIAADTTRAPSARTGVTAVALVIAIVLELAVYHAAGPVMALLFLVGLALGLVLFHSRFGFTSAWRQLVVVGQGRAIRAHMLVLGAACLLFAVVLGSGVGLP